MHAYLNIAARLGALTLAALALGQASVATAQPKDIKIGLVYSRTGPLEAYGKQTRRASRWVWTTPPAAR